MISPGKGGTSMSINSDQPAQPPPLPGRPPLAVEASVPKEDLIPVWLVIGIFAVVMALTLFLLKDNWQTDMTRYRSIKAQQRGDWASAAEHLNRLVQAGVQVGNTEVSLSPTYLSELGYIYFNMAKYDKALDYYQQAQVNRANVPPDEQGNPRPPYDFNGMIGLTQFKMGNLDAAQKSLQAALLYNKVDPLSNFTLGEIAMQQANYTQAADYFKVVAGNAQYEAKVKEYYAEIEKKLFAGIN